MSKEPEDLVVYLTQASKYQMRINNLKKDLDDVVRDLEVIKNLLSATDYDLLTSYLYDFDSKTRSKIETIKTLCDASTEIDVMDLRVGDNFSSAGYQSSSVLLENCYGIKDNVRFSDTNIILEIIVPPNFGTAAYIENDYCF